MTNKKTQPTSCCAGAKKLPLIIVGIAIIILFIIWLLNKEVQEMPLEEGVQSTPVVAEKTTTVTPDQKMEQKNTEQEVLNEELVADETPLPATTSEKTVLNLNAPNTLTKPKMTEAENLVYTFLTDYNQKNFEEACDTLVDTKCDATIAASVERFGEELDKMNDGYQNISVHQVDVPDFHSDIVCVEYDYRYKSSSNTNPIHEVLSFYVQDGKITYRICEDKTRDGEKIGCPIQSRRDFCLK